MNWTWLQKIGKALEDTLKDSCRPKMPITEPLVENAELMKASNPALAERWQETQLAAQEQLQEIKLLQIKLYYIQQIHDRQFQEPRARLAPKQANELQGFIQSIELAKKDNDRDFYQWRFDQEKQIQTELEQCREEFQSERQPIRSKHF